MSLNNYTDEKMTHVKDEEFEYLTFNILEKYSDKLKHFITLRHGGVSSGDFESLNFRMANEGEKANVLKNVDIVLEKMNMDNIYKGKQTHSDNILIITGENKIEFEIVKASDEEYDGYICSEKNIPTMITTADCNPVIMYDPIHNVVANIHSGWKGTIQKIYIKALKKMKENFDTNYDDTIVCVGPAVQKCCFSSTEEKFKKIFTQVWECEKEYISYDENEKDRFHIDLSYVIQKDLIDLGIKKENIVISNICTSCNHEDFFSYRYKTRTNALEYGTMGTIVELK